MSGVAMSHREEDWNRAVAAAVMLAADFYKEAD